MTDERKGAVTLQGNPLTLLGPELAVGDRAPDFEVVGKNFKPVTLADTQGKVRVFSVVTSLDTPVCDVMSRRFNSEAAKLPGVAMYTISMDLPYAQMRWSVSARASRMTLLSDYRNASFGIGYGTLIKELRLESRAIFVLDESGVIRHVEYVEEIGNEPDYEAALEAVGRLVKG